MTDNELLLAMSNMLDTKLSTQLRPIKEDIQVMKGEIRVLKEDVQGLKEDMQFMKTDLQRVKLYQENILEPRLNTIEACYTSTYNRYKNDVDKMEIAFDDIDTLKKVVARHSEQLRKLA